MLLFDLLIDLVLIDLVLIDLVLIDLVLIDLVFSMSLCIVQVLACCQVTLVTKETKVAKV